MPLDLSAGPDIIVYDLETKETFQMVGGRDARALTISVLGAYFYREDEYVVYEEHELPEFWRRLETCDLLIGFNNKGFDDVVVSGYFPEVMKVPRFDILEEVHRALGFRVKLDNLAHATLETGKSGDGLMAIKLWAEGRLEELKSYCKDDVEITKRIYDFGKRHGFLKFKDVAGVKEVPVNFNREVARPQEAMNLSLF